MLLPTDGSSNRLKIITILGKIMRARRHLTNMYHVLTFSTGPACQEIHHESQTNNNKSIVGGKKDGKERRKEEGREEGR